MTNTVQLQSDQHWHDLRRQHIGGSEVAALFGEHTQVTPFELWHRKKGNLPEADLSDNARVFWGTILEPAIAAGVSKKKDWTVRKVRRYLSNPDVGLGGSLDYEIVAQADRGPGILEIKTADWIVAKNWQDGEPPLAYMLQVMSYLALTGRSWGCMAVLVGGNDLRLFEFERRPATIAIIEAKVKAFWTSIRDGIEPKPDFARDAASVASLYGEAAAGKIIDLTSSNRFPSLIAEYQDAATAKRAGEKAAEAAKAEIMTLVGDAEIAICGDMQVKTSLVAGVPDKIISTEMVGSAIKGRKGYRGLWISARKEKAA